MTSTLYVGKSQVRRISIADWAAVGITAAADTVWSSANGYIINQTALSVAQIASLQLDSDFLVNQPDTPRPGVISTYDRSQPADKGYVDDKVAAYRGGTELAYAALANGIILTVDGTIPDPGALLAVSPTVGVRPITVRAKCCFQFGRGTLADPTDILVQCYIYDENNVIRGLDSETVKVQGASTTNLTLRPEARLNPTSGVHTYRVRYKVALAAGGSAVGLNTPVLFGDDLGFPGITYIEALER